MPENFQDIIKNIPHKGLRAKAQFQFDVDRNGLGQNQINKLVGQVPDIFREKLRTDLEGLVSSNQLRSIAENPSGFSPEQLSKLIENIQQQVGATGELETARLKQATAGQPQSVKAGALQGQQNNMLKVLTQALTQLQASGADRQMQALLASIQQNFQQQQLQAQNEKSLFDSLAQLGLGIGQIAAGSPITGGAQIANSISGTDLDPRS